MANCCYERFVLLNPHTKCCFRYQKPICLEFTYFLCQIIAVIFLIWGKIKIPWEIYKKRDSDVKLINGLINRIVLIFCYIIYNIDNIGSGLLLIALILILYDFSKIYSDSHKLVNPFEEYPAVLTVFCVNGACEIVIQIPFMVDIQLIRFKTELSYDEYKMQNQGNIIQIRNEINDTMAKNINNAPQGENITVQNNLQNLNGTEMNMINPIAQKNINDQQNPQNQ